MEYVDADTLRNRRTDRPLGFFHPGEIADWMRQLCEALDYAHWQAAIVHRDLKPANLMINRKSQLKVSDFGISCSLAESLTEHTKGNAVSGTLLYMSPQQLNGETGSPLDDIYSVGATIYELCTSRTPFYSGDVAGQISTKIAPSMTARRESLGLPIGEIPENWERTIAACLSKDPGLRPQSAGAIAIGLGLIEAASLPSSRLPGLRPVTRRRPRVRRPRTRRVGRARIEAWSQLWSWGPCWRLGWEHGTSATSGRRASSGRKRSLKPWPNAPPSRSEQTMQKPSRARRSWKRKIWPERAAASS
jgi:serine/threonine protein kinase